MKFLNMFTIFILCTIIFSCTPKLEKSNSREYFFALDVTASAEKNHPLNLDEKRITRLLDLDSDPNAHVRYSQSLLTETSLNFKTSFELSPINPEKFHKYRRNAKVKKFTANVINALTELEQATYDRATSNIFLALSKIINTIAKNDMDEQHLYVISDILDNSFLFSAYDKNQMKKLQKSPDYLAEILNKHAPIDYSLDKMKITIIHQANAKTDYLFHIVSNAYKTYLQSKGSTVEIVANL